MKKEQLFDIMGEIDDKYISEAREPCRKKRNSWLRWGTLAACAALVIAAGILIIPRMGEDDISSQGAGDRNYSRFVISSDSYMEWQWEYRSASERFTSVDLGGSIYQSRGRKVNEALLGGSLGSAVASGYDTYSDKTYTEQVQAFSINGVSEERIIAVGLDGEYYVYFCNSTELPATFGEVLELYDLPNTLRLERFAECENGREASYYSLSDDERIWQILSECGDGKAYEDPDMWYTGERDYLSFTATSEQLGVYKRVFYVSEDGYVSTNIFDYGYVFFIGEEAAGRIISYARENAEAAEREPYEYSISGIVTEIGEDYLLVDDTALCADASEGIVFRVLADDIRIKRWLDSGRIKAGDAVSVTFADKAAISADNTVSGAHGISKGTIYEGDVIIPE